MRVLVDAHMVGSRETGNETYVRNLLSALNDMDGVQAAAALPASGRGVDPSLAGESIVLNPPGDWMRLAYALPRACREWGADVLHVTYVRPVVCGCPVVVSVHDVSFRRFPEFFSPRDRLLFSTLMPALLRRANAIVTLSDHARAEIIDWLPTLADRVFVTPLAASSLFRPIPRDHGADTLRRFGIRGRYVLAVGNLQPRKNLERLTNAFAALHDRHRDVQLVLVGKDHWQSGRIHDAARTLYAHDAVVLTGYVSTADLVALYSGADVFAYPSLYEGFGLPIVEAMACGAPVITSSTTSMPEVAGDAALLVDPYSIDSIAGALDELLGSEDRRRELRDAGLRRASTFSWRRTAEDTMLIYERVVADRRPR